MKKRQKLVRLTELAVLLAMIILLEVTGLGMFKTVGLEITILQVPVIIGAIVLGPLDGAILGACFGMVSFFECFGKSPFGATLLSINPIFTFLVCVPTRVLMGWLCGLIFKASHSGRQKSKAHILSYGLASLCGAVLNTLLFMGMLCLCFYNTEFIQGIAADLKAENFLVFVVFFVGLQGLIEALFCTVVGTLVSKALHLSLHKA